LVDFAEYGWFPRQLPSHAAEGLDPFIDSDEEE
jgi:methylated-DNA-protein-cysteine methyltransferase related protein